MAGACLVGLAAGAVRAAAPFELSWTAPSECPSRMAVEARIQKLLAGSDGGSTVVASAKITKKAKVYALALETSTDGVKGERSLEDASCEALADSAALIVAMAVDPTIDPLPPASSATTASATADAPSGPIASSAPPTPSPAAPPLASAPAQAPPPPPPPPPSAPPSAPPARPADVASSAPVRVSSGVSGDAVAGALPGVALGVSPRVAMDLEGVRFEVLGRFVPHARREVNQPSGAGGVFSLFAFGAGVARTWTFSRLEVGPSIGLEAGTLRARGYGVDRPQEGTGTWLATTPGALALLRFGDFALRLDASAVVALMRPEFVIEGASAVFRPASVGARLGLGAELRF